MIRYHTMKRYHYYFSGTQSCSVLVFHVHCSEMHKICAELKQEQADKTWKKSCSEGVYLGRSDGAAMVGLADNIIDDHLGDLPRHFLLCLNQSTHVMLLQSF